MSGKYRSRFPGIDIFSLLQWQNSQYHLRVFLQQRDAYALFLFLLFLIFFFFWLAIWQIDRFSSCWWIIRYEDWARLKDSMLQKEQLSLHNLSFPCFQARTTYHLIFASKKSTMFIKLNIISLYSKPHSFVTNEYNKHQCIVNLRLKPQIPKLLLLVAEHWTGMCPWMHIGLEPFNIYPLEPLLNWVNSCRHSRKLNFSQNISGLSPYKLIDLFSVLQKARVAAALNLTRCLFPGTSAPVTCINWKQKRGSAFNNVVPECLKSQAVKGTGAIYSVQILKFQLLLSFRNTRIWYYPCFEKPSQNNPLCIPNTMSSNYGIAWRHLKLCRNWILSVVINSTKLLEQMFMPYYLSTPPLLSLSFKLVHKHTLNY